MNVTLDTQFSVSGNTESVTTTYKPAASPRDTGIVSGSGYSLGIADQVMDNEAYGGHGMTAEELMQQAANTDAGIQKDYMVVMSSCVSGEDYQKMQEEGFRPGSTDVETYVTIVDRIKVTLAQAGVAVEGYTDNIDLETVEQITGNQVTANELADTLAQALQESDMPVTSENVTELAKAVMEASGIGELSEDAIKFLIVNKKEPTIGNLYKAQYSSTGSVRQSQGYYSEGAGNYGKYYAKKADNINWDNLNSRIEAVVKQAGLDSDKDTKAEAVSNARWLVESGIELNEENLTRVTDLKNLTLPMEQQEIAQLCVTAMENGKAPLQADMTGEQSVARQAHEIVEEVGQISDEAVHDVVESGQEVTIKNLAAAQKQIEENQAENAGRESDNANNASLQEIEARRQLEEIRLMMTEEANRHLLKAGISVDTAQLSELVEALKAAEENIRSVLFRGDSAEENAQRSELYGETISRTKEIADMPAAVLGRIMSRSSEYTLLRIHEEGSKLQNEQQGAADRDSAGGQPNQDRQRQAAQSYETLMTAPRKDLGDKISKAFRNVDDILDDMGLETSDANRRAVRILGYNRMDITEENIGAVKEADSQVTGVIRRMTPATTLQMIREQKNPLEMTMKELEEYLDSRDAEPVEDTGKYAKFLQRLDRTGGIGEDEREAYMGIYRMFRQIEKSDGAVIGSIVSTGAEMNFKNMLSAVRTAADKDMDVRVDDGFGALENLIEKGKAIDDQINAGYRQQADSQTKDQEAQQKYYARLSGEINEELTERTDFEKLGAVEITGGTTIEQFADNIKMTRVSEEDRRNAENAEDFRESVRAAQQIDEQAVEMLIDFGQPVSVDNIEAASMLLFERGSLFRQVIGQSGRNVQDDAEGDMERGDLDGAEGTESAVLRQADRFIDGLSDAGQAKASYQEIIREANKAVENMVYTDSVSHIDVKAAQALYKGLSLAGSLAREENYEVPMEINGEITSVNLKIYHNASQTGKVAVTFDTESLGRVAAEFDVMPERVSGLVVYDNRQGQAQMERMKESVQSQLSEGGTKQVTVSFVREKSLDFGKFGQDRDAGSGQEKLPTAELYRTAKAFLTALKSAAE